jgi:hypothetical protein
VTGNGRREKQAKESKNEAQTVTDLIHLEDGLVLEKGHFELLVQQASLRCL